MKKPTKSDIERVMKVNKTLRDLNYSWHEIETFWKECFQISKSKLDCSKFPSGGIMANKTELKN